MTSSLAISSRLRAYRGTESARTGLGLRFVVEVVGLSRVQPAHTIDSLVSGLAWFSNLQVDPSGTEVLQRGEFDLSLGLRDSSPTESGRTALVLRFVGEVVGLVAGRRPLVQGL